jgi:hypothetical protein
MEVTIPSGGSPYLTTSEGKAATTTLNNGETFSFTPFFRESSRSKVVIVVANVTRRTELGQVEVEVGGGKVTLPATPASQVRVIREIPVSVAFRLR